MNSYSCFANMISSLRYQDVNNLHDTLALVISCTCTEMLLRTSAGTK